MIEVKYTNMATENFIKVPYSILKGCLKYPYLPSVYAYLQMNRSAILDSVNLTIEDIQPLLNNKTDIRFRDYDKIIEAFKILTFGFKDSKNEISAYVKSSVELPDFNSNKSDKPDNSDRVSNSFKKQLITFEIKQPIEKTKFVKFTGQEWLNLISITQETNSHPKGNIDFYRLLNLYLITKQKAVRNHALNEIYSDGWENEETITTAQLSSRSNISISTVKKYMSILCNNNMVTAHYGKSDVISYGIDIANYVIN